MSDERIQQMHSYALARIMKHTIGFENFEPSDHAIHGMLVDHKTGHLDIGNVNETIKKRIDSHKRMVESFSKQTD